MVEAERAPKIQKSVSKDRISLLPDDLLLQILLFLPTKKAVSTMFLSKRWRFVWTMLPRLFYKDKKNGKSKSIWWFLDGSMRFHNAPVLELLCIKLGPQCPVDFDVAKWVSKAVDRGLCCLYFKLLWNTEPIRMPSSLYTCKTLVALTLSHKILVDVPSSVCLPSLTELNLLSVGYKDEDSHVRLLSNCPVLAWLYVKRREEVDDNVKKFTVRVPSLKTLTYVNKVIEDEEEEEDDEEEDVDTDKSLVIDTPALEYLHIDDTLLHSCSTEYMPDLVQSSIVGAFYPNGNFLRSLSSIYYIDFTLDDTMDPWWSTLNYSHLTDCSIQLDDPLYELLVVLLSNCPKLEAFKVKSLVEIDDEPLSWNQPSYVPKCLLSHLNIFKWKGYLGREDEKGLVSYIIENSKCLKTVKISPDSTYDPEEKLKMMQELNIHALSFND